MSRSDLFARAAAELTLGKLLREKALQYGSKKAALRVKALGIWQETSWQEYYENTAEISLGLLGAGLQSGETLAIIGHNRPASLYTLIATGLCGAVPVCIHPESTAAEIAAFIRRFNLKYILAEDQEQVDKILDNPANATALRKIIYCNPRGMRGYGDDRLMSLNQLLALGRDLGAKEPRAFDGLVSAGLPGDTALICTTSGVSGEQKGALLSHNNILSTAAALVAATTMKEGHEAVSFLPLSWMGELMISLAAALLAGFTVNFPESQETVMQDLREIGPHIIFAPPEIWGGIASSVQIKTMESSPFKRFMYRTFIPAGERIAKLKLAGSEVGLSARISYKIAHILLIRALRDRLGLTRVKIAITGGSPLGNHAFSFFHSIGVNLKQAYGLTEIAGVAAMHRDGEIRPETSGILLPGIEAKIAADGEILLKGPGVFKGYYGEEGSAVDGWLHTGDAGHLDADGQLTVTDRCDSIFTLADGRIIAPQRIESSIRLSPYIKESIVFGAGLNYPAALVCIDAGTVGKWAGDSKLSYSTYSDLASKHEVYDLITAELKQVNDNLAADRRIERFAILYKDLDPDDAELSRTGKIRRNTVQKRFSNLIHALNSGAQSLEIDEIMEFGDSKSARVRCSVSFRNLT